MDIKKWWDRQTNTDKAVLGLSAFCIWAVLFIVLAGILVPDITYLSLDTNNAQIDNQTIEYKVHGQTEPHAKVLINAADLNLNGVPVAVSKNGSFEYNLKIPAEVTDTKVSVISKSGKKYEVSQNIEIQRPLTFLSIKPMQKLNYGVQNVELEGQSDPNATICIISNMTLRNNLNLQSYLNTVFDDPMIQNITIKADSKGYFKHEFIVPSNSTSAYFNVTAKSAGKRSTTQVQNITRSFETFPPITSIFNMNDDSNVTKMKYFSGKGFSISYPAFWQNMSYKYAGKDSRLYFVYGNSVEGIVWHGTIGKEFGNSLQDYKQTQDNYMRDWWGGTEVFEQNINANGITGFRTIYKCKNNPVFSNNIPAPFYIDRTTLTKDNKNVLELQLMVEEYYYEQNNYIIGNTVQSFKIY